MGQKILEIYNWYSGKKLFEFELPPKLTAIKIKTHPARKTKEAIGSRSLTLAELLRMPSAILSEILKTVDEKDRDRFYKIVTNRFKQNEIDQVRYHKLASKIQQMRTEEKKRA